MIKDVWPPALHHPHSPCTDDVALFESALSISLRPGISQDGWVIIITQMVTRSCGSHRISIDVNALPSMIPRLSGSIRTICQCLSLDWVLHGGYRPVLFHNPNSRWLSHRSLFFSIILTYTLPHLPHPQAYVYRVISRRTISSFHQYIASSSQYWPRLPVCQPTRSSQFLACPC